MKGKDISPRHQILSRSPHCISISFSQSPCYCNRNRIAVHSQRHLRKLFFATVERMFLAVPQVEHHDDNVVRGYEVWTAFESVTWVAIQNFKTVAMCQDTKSCFVPEFSHVPFHNDISCCIAIEIF